MYQDPRCTWYFLWAGHVSPDGDVLPEGAVGVVHPDGRLLQPHGGQDTLQHLHVGSGLLPGLQLGNRGMWSLLAPSGLPELAGAPPSRLCWSWTFPWPYDRLEVEVATWEEG